MAHTLVNGRDHKTEVRTPVWCLGFRRHPKVTYEEENTLCVPPPKLYHRLVEGGDWGGVEQTGKAEKEEVEAKFVLPVLINPPARVFVCACL